MGFEGTVGFAGFCAAVEFESSHALRNMLMKAIYNAVFFIFFSLSDLQVGGG
nr:Tetraspanin family [Moritella viscosa]SHO05122.1 Tetraspanin family [Moritella viscosa]